MSASFSKRLSKIAVTLAVTCGIALGLCGLNLGLFSVRSIPVGLHNSLVMTGVVELVVAGACVLGLLIVGVVAIVHALSGHSGKDEEAP